MNYTDIYRLPIAEQAKLVKVLGITSMKVRNERIIQSVLSCRFPPGLSLTHSLNTLTI